MTSPEEIFDVVRLRLHQHLAAGRVPFEGLAVLPDWQRLARGMLGVALPAQIMLDKDAERGNSFQLHPSPQTASPRSWVWVFAARYGYAATLLNLSGPKVFPLYLRWQNACEKDWQHRARMESAEGPMVNDLVAVSPDLTRVLGRLGGYASVLGYPQEATYEGDARVRLYRNVRGWLADRCGGAVLVGTAAENDVWLRGCDGGIVTDDLAHGQAIRKQLMRPYHGPKVLVAA